MKFILVFVNILFLLAGALMLAFGITGKVDEDAIADMFEAILPSQSREDLDQLGVNLSEIIASNSTFMIILGIVVIVIAIFGFVGACCMVRWMLVVYAIILIVVFLAQIALIIFAAVFGEKFKENVQEGMYKSLQEGYHKGMHITGSNVTEVVLPVEAVELAWDTTQFKKQCCGAYNYTDYGRLDDWEKPGSYPNPVVPLSCCKKSDAVTGDTPTSSSDFVDIQNCLAGVVEQIHSENCYDALKDDIDEFITTSRWIAIGIAIGICVIELLLIIFAFCLCARAKDDKYV